MADASETRQSHLEDTGILWCATHGRMLPPSFSHRCHADDPEPCDVRRLLVSDSGREEASLGQHGPIEVTKDARGRISLGKLGVRPGQRFWVFEQSDGSIILQPVVSDSASEQ